MSSSSGSLSNKIIMNKFLWMSRQLWHFNDAGSIVNWANAMHLVKGLLIDPQPTTPVTDNLRPSSPQTSTSHVFTTINPQRAYSDRSITPPTSICFQPSKMKSLTKSPTYCSNIVPAKPKPLTIYSHRQPTISPTNSLAPSPKRRKTDIPPVVNYHASTTNITNSITSSQPMSNAITTRKPPSTTAISMDPTLPDGWYFCYNKTNGQHYYWNKITGATQWAKPVKRRRDICK